MTTIEQRVPWEYAQARESTDIVHIADRYGLFIGGEFVEPRSGRWFTSVNPATEEPIAEVAEAGAEDVDAAVHAARVAYQDVWREMRGRDRAKFLFRIARMIQERSREFAVLESLNGGKPIKESRDVDLPLA
ncbi:MAG: aldehyde dehydrogenase family protein, partial [Actinomycetota bacterium]